jgi:hypothetical protein
VVVFSFILLKRRPFEIAICDRVAELGLRMTVERHIDGDWTVVGYALLERCVDISERPSVIGRERRSRRRFHEEPVELITSHQVEIRPPKEERRGKALPSALITLR